MTKKYSNATIEGKISIITPCYNGENYLHRFLDSLLIQEYKNVELIFVNDGSTDKTEEIFLLYKEKFEQKGWNVIYIKQANQGQAAALNAGLKIFSGEYLMWPDSDDILYPEHLTKKVELMKNNPQAGIGFCWLDQVTEENLTKVEKILKREHNNLQDDFAGDLILNRNILWPPIGAIIRSSAFFDVNPHREIYAGKAGQNFQMFFPVGAKYSVCYLDESLGQYLIRETSHSRSQNDYQQRQFDHEDTWVHTIMRSPLSDEQKTKAIIRSVNHYEQLKMKKMQIKQKIKPRKVKIFGFIPLLKICFEENKTIVKLFDFIPILSIR